MQYFCEKSEALLQKSLLIAQVNYGISLVQEICSKLTISSQGPSLVSWWTPAGNALHSE